MHLPSASTNINLSIRNYVMDTKLAEATANMKTSAHQNYSEGMIARTIENQTARLPSDTFL